MAGKWSRVWSELNADKAGPADKVVNRSDLVAVRMAEHLAWYLRLKGREPYDEEWRVIYRQCLKRSGTRKSENGYRKIYQRNVGPIPVGYEIHHLDFDHSNDDPWNLVALTTEEHDAVHAASSMKRSFLTD